MSEIPTPVANRDKQRDSKLADLTAQFLSAVDKFTEYSTEHYPKVLTWIVSNIHGDRDAQDLAKHFIGAQGFSDRQILRVYAHLERERKMQNRQPWST